MRKRQSVECLRDDRNSVFIFEPATLLLGQLRCVRAIDKFCYEINDSVVRAAIDELDDVLMLERCRDVDLAHETAHGFITDRKLGKQSLYGNGSSGLLLATKHHCAH